MSEGHQEISAEIHETELPGCPERPKEKKIIHFASGETLEEEDSEEEEDVEELPPQRSPFQRPSERTRFSLKKTVVLLGRISLLTCDFFGRSFAGALGLDVSKYQYAMDQYRRDQKATRSRAAGGPVESTHRSPGPAGGRYGATGHASCTAAPHQRPEDLKEGCYNRGYQEDDDSK
ncbi:protein FAM177B [Salarias fasciatus]|uniref:protein FAM177B n=1 Tax=Salarias fasciatus TaxID=181472 RepID=UPI00117674E1|nr:protein FAM177B [Salarias fasciatus]